MNKRLILALIAVFTFTGCSVLSPLQRSKYLTVSHLTETAQYAEAKALIEEMVENPEFKDRSRTWQMRGILAHDAYRDGIRRNDRNRYELYPDQLQVAFESYERASQLDGRGRMERQLRPRFVLLANDFQQLGERNFRNNNFSESRKAFEKALEIAQRPSLSMQPDTNLVYNAALAAYEAREWENATKHLRLLHKNAYSTNVTHLLYKSKLAVQDSTAAAQVLREGIEVHDEVEDLVLLLADFFVSKDEPRKAQQVLDNAIVEDSANDTYHYTKGLIYQKSGRFNDAILSYFEAIRFNPDQVITHVNIATCYYNIGVEIEEESRTLSSNAEVREKRMQSEAAYEAALTWLDEAQEKTPTDQEILLKIYELYRMLRVNDRARSVEEKMNGR